MHDTDKVNEYLGEGILRKYGSIDYVPLELSNS